MTNLTFYSDKLKKGINILFYLFLSAYFFLVGIIQNHLIPSIVFFVLAGICVCYLIVNNFIRRKIWIEENALYLQFLSKKKCIHLDKVLWYTKNLPNVSSLFCKSQKNICLFYEGKKETLSIKEIDYLESLLAERKIDYINPQNTDNHLEEKKIYPVEQYIQIAGVPLFMVAINTFLTQATKCPEKTAAITAGIAVLVLSITTAIIFIKERLDFKKRSAEK